MTGTGAARGSPPDPLMAFQFTAKAGSRHGTQVIGGFTDVSGLSIEHEVETIKVGGVNDRDVTLPGPAKYPSRLMLKRGLGDAAMLWGWYLEVLGGAIKREDVTITLHRPDGRSGPSWTFSAACPVKWIGPELHGANAAVAFEAIELVHRGLLVQHG